MNAHERAPFRASANPIGIILLTVGMLFFPSASTFGAADSSPDLTKVAANSTNLSSSQIQQMEISLYTSPNDATTRAKLLGYYFLRKTESIQPRLQHILWMIQNRPADPFTGSAYCHLDPNLDAAGYKQAITLWQQIVAANPTNPEILQNAAEAYSPEDDASAEAILMQGSELQPKSPNWTLRLAQLYERRAIRSRDDRAKSAAAALQQRQKTCNLEKNPARRFADFTEMPRDAYMAGNTIAAKHLARQLLGMAENFPDDWNYGNAIHVANIVLGRVALRAGDIEAAKVHLLAAGQTPGSAQLDSIGPDMTLAKELLEQGHRHIVHEYLDLCTKFWTAGSTRLKAWTATVDAGGIPDFGNLAID